MILTLLTSIFIVGCNDENDHLTNTTVTEEKDIEIVKISTDGTSFETVDPNQITLRSDGEIDDSYALRFKNEAVYEETVNRIEQDSLVIDEYSNLRSIAEIYEEAMEWADKHLDETEASYKQWKALYGAYLYFPEYKEDYGAYLPVSNEAAATVSNANGLVVVGSEIKNTKDISTYTELQDIGHDAYYREPSEEGEDEIQLRFLSWTSYHV